MSRRRARPWRAALGAQARKDGRAGEWLAAFWLMAKGWRILGWRLRSPAGEIDILARRGRILAVVEVKRRATIEAALCAVTPVQQERLRRAGAAVAAGRPDLGGLELRLDMVALAPGRRPRHIADAWGPTGKSRAASRPL